MKKRIETISLRAFVHTFEIEKDDVAFVHTFEIEKEDVKLEISYFQNYYFYIFF